jgi:ATP-dependent Clp protease ATP-binding subunit ClpA
VIQKDVRDPLTDQILFGALEQGGTVTIGVADDRLSFNVAPRDTPPSAAPSAAE